MACAGSQWGDPLQDDRVGRVATKVVVIHDAAIDEYVSVILLAGMEEVELAGSVIVNADCIGGPAMQVQWRIQQLIGAQHLPLSLSGARGLNPFPWPYRSDCLKVADLAPLQRFPANDRWPPYPDGDAWLRDFFAGLEGSVTLLCLCPLTPVQMLLDALPEAAAKIDRMVWMGGAIDVVGNLDPTTIPPQVANPYAEWNVFWDPPAADDVLRRTEFPITLFPLDVTDTAKITPGFMARLLQDGKTYPVADLALQAYSLVSDEPFYDMWDVAAAAWLARPQLYDTPEKLKLRVVTDDEKQGALVPDPAGREVEVVRSFADLDGFYAYVGEQLRR